MPVEATENVAPIVFWTKELRPDSGGAGRTRGGTGQTMEVGAKGDLEFAVNATFDRVANAPKGREGGLDGAAGVVALKSGKTLRTKGFQVIPDGDRLILKLPGGAGMGDPTARDPALVARDVRDGLVSAENARALYKVAVEADGTLDETATSDVTPGRCNCVSIPAKPISKAPLPAQRPSRRVRQGDAHGRGHREIGHAQDLYAPAAVRDPELFPRLYRPDQRELRRR